MILNKNQLVENISLEISDNSTGDITPYDIRHNLLDIIDSVHLLLNDKTISTLNIGTPDTRSTRLGIETLSKINLDGYSSVDNTAIGYSALKSNYDGERNTALGSHALSCNIYGVGNLALGYNSLGGNSVGYGNIGVGNYSLNGNKIGNFNIAIGHGAGYYTDRNTSNKLFIATYPVDGSYICDNPLGSGLTPLVYGDLSELKFGIAVNTLHDFGSLQVSGAISPSDNAEYSIGHSSYQWKYIYLNSGIQFPNSKNILSDDSGNLFSNTDILPSQNNTQNLGSSSNRWGAGFFEDVFISGNATINSLISIESSQYLDKTLYLAASGDCTSNCSYLSDGDLIGGGIVLKSTSADYELLFNYNDTSISCLETDDAFSRSYWKSNISLHINSGCHLHADRLINKDFLSISTYPDCHGIYLDSGIFYVSRENVLSPTPHSSNGHLAGVGNINFIANSGETADYNITYSAPESGVNISQKFISNTKLRVKDASNSYKDKLSGFELKYYDDSPTGDLDTDRFTISSYDQTSKTINSAILLKNSNDGGVFGISSFDANSDYVLPNTTFNVRSKNDAIARITAENAGSVEAALQLLGTNNCLQDGFEITYKNISGVADFNIYKDSGVVNSIRVDENNHVGIYATVSGNMSDMLTLGDALRQNAVIALRQYNSNPSSTENYGKLFVKEKLVPNQSSSIYFADTSGNYFDIILNKYNDNDGLLYSDSNRNTFGGIHCPDSRTDLSLASDNTVIGYQAAALINEGDQNTIYGSYAGSGLFNGSNNVAIGYKSLFNCEANVSNNIIIGTNALGEGLDQDNTFLLGISNDVVLMSGVLGPSNTEKSLHLPQGGSLAIYNTNHEEFLQFSANNISVVDNKDFTYPTNELLFNFTANSSATLLKLNHSGVPLTNSVAYASSTRPFAELNGDLKLKGDIRFYDGTSLHSSSFLDDISTLESQVSGINNTLDGIFIEGSASENIAPAIGIENPSSGNMSLRSGGSALIINRDKYLQINQNDYMIAIKIGSEYRPLWVSSESSICG